jgi:hypothetical protein
MEIATKPYKKIDLCENKFVELMASDEKNSTTKSISFKKKARSISPKTEKISTIILTGRIA